MGLKIIAWNVNGLRSLLKTEELKKILELEPDIICLGETKLSCKTEENFKEDFLEEYKYKYWSLCTTRQGYSGTAIFSKKKPLNIIYGLNEIDNEGRVITLEYKNYYLLHVYTPNSGEKLNRLKWRTEIWDREFEKYINKLQEKKPIIICGDLNVAHKEIDLKNPSGNKYTAGYTKEERESFEEILKNCNLVDIYRYLNPTLIEYTYWSYRFKSRERNIGWRIDYFLTSNILKNKIKTIKILNNIYGSDHAPILMIL